MKKESGKNYNNLDKELVALGELLGIRVKDMESRLVKEAVLEVEFPSFSNEAVAQYAISGEKYSYRELEKRIYEGEVFNLKTLFLLADPLANSSISTKSEKRLVNLIYKGIENSAEEAEMDDVVNLVCEYGQTQLDANIGILDEVLSFRLDMEEIFKRVMSKVQIIGIEGYLEELGKRAMMCRENR